MKGYGSPVCAPTPCRIAWRLAAWTRIGEMARYSIAEAGKNLPELIDKVLAGEEVALTREGEAVVELRPSAPDTRPPRRGGMAAAAGPPRRSAVARRGLGSSRPRDARSRAVTVYLDASFVVSLFVTDVHTERADRWLHTCGAVAVGLLGRVRIKPMRPHHYQRSEQQFDLACFPSRRVCNRNDG